MTRKHKLHDKAPYATAFKSELRGALEAAGAVIDGGAFDAFDVGGSTAVVRGDNTTVYVGVGVGVPFGLGLLYLLCRSNNGQEQGRKSGAIKRSQLESRLGNV